MRKWQKILQELWSNSAKYLFRNHYDVMLVIAFAFDLIFLLLFCFSGEPKFHHSCLKSETFQLTPSFSGLPSATTFHSLCPKSNNCSNSNNSNNRSNSNNCSNSNNSTSSNSSLSFQFSPICFPRWEPSRAARPWRRWRRNVVRSTTSTSASSPSVRKSTLPSISRRRRWTCRRRRRWKTTPKPTSTFCRSTLNTTLSPNDGASNKWRLSSQTSSPVRNTLRWVSSHCN